MTSKHDRLDEFLAGNDLEAVWFAQPASFAWLADGRNVIDRRAPVGFAAVGYDGFELTVVADSIEADRLRDEEFDGVPVDRYDWFDGSLATAVANRSRTPAAADFDVPGFERVDPSSLRHPLEPYEVERYRELGRETAAAVETVCRKLESGDTEREVATALRIALGARGIDAPVVLVGGEDRASRYRHCVPTDTVLGGYAVISVTAERDGLHASCSRTVAFDPPSWLPERHGAAASVETEAIAATRRAALDGGTAADVFAAIQDAYGNVGWPDEWREHHQGGAAGYAGREWIATPTLDEPVTSPMAYAWNPTVEGAKSEDTVLVDGAAVEVLTSTGEWPTATVESRDGAVMIDRPGILKL